MLPGAHRLFGLGGPEIAAVLVLGVLKFAIPIAIVVLIVKMATRPKTLSRYCPQCGRGLTQAADAPFCGYCGARLPQ
jgi:hypothetical protein